MKIKKPSFVILVGFMVLNVFLITSAAEATAQQWTNLPATPGRNVWKNKAEFTFSPAPSAAQSPAYKNDLGLNEGEERLRSEMDDGRFPQTKELVEKIPYVRSVFAMKEKYMNRLNNTLDNPDGRLFSPILKKQDNQETMPGQKLSGQVNNEKEGMANRNSSKEAQERYFIGYRLNSPQRQTEETWFFGFGWKSGNGGRNRRDMAEKDGKNTMNIETAGFSDADKNGDVVKAGYSGPILALVGQF